MVDISGETESTCIMIESALNQAEREASPESFDRENSKSMAIHVENKTVSVRLRGASITLEGAPKVYVHAVPTTLNPTTSPKIDATLAPMNAAGSSRPPSTVLNRTKIKIVIPNMFYVCNNVGLTSVNFSVSSSIFMQLNDTYNSLLDLLYAVDGMFELISSIINVTDIPCKLSSFDQTLCQKVKAKHPVALLDSREDVNKAYGKLVALTEAAVDAGKLQKLLVTDFPASHLTIRKEIVNEDDVVVRNSFLLKNTDFVNESTLQSESNVYRLLLVGYEYMNNGIVTSSTISDIAYVPKSAMPTKVVAIDCPGKSNIRCQNVSASYNVTVPSSIGADAQFVERRLSNLTSEAIASGFCRIY